MQKILNCLYIIRPIVRPFVILYIPAFVMYKLLTALLSEQIVHAGPSFSHFGIVDWCFWLINIRDIVGVSIYVGFYFIIGVYWLRSTLLLKYQSGVPLLARTSFFSL